jgi:hypothetical protein
MKVDAAESNLRCVECSREQAADERGWRAFLERYGHLGVPISGRKGRRAGEVAERGTTKVPPQAPGNGDFHQVHAPTGYWCLPPYASEPPLTPFGSHRGGLKAQKLWLLRQEESCPRPCVLPANQRQWRAEAQIRVVVVLQSS